MDACPPTREEALTLLLEYTRNPALISHALAVEAVMRHIARKRGGEGEEEMWGIVGLIHDLDYERFPDRHCVAVAEILRERNWPEDIIRAVVSHGWGLCSDVEPFSDIEKTLYAIDELTGLITACALVRPSRSVMDMEVGSVKKKWKQKAFAAGADREVILRGAAMLGVDLDELIADTILGMRSVAGVLGL
jgi:predicted hydrolase (HD superfamily)